MREFKGDGICLEVKLIVSVRLPGLVAHQEVIFGSVGQTLTIRHDSIWDLLYERVKEENSDPSFIWE